LLLGYKEGVNISEYSQQILLGETVAEKMIFGGKIDFDDWKPMDLPKAPGRAHKIQFSDQNIRFPKGHFHEAEKKAMALHAFANHELLATEMMAAALLIFPHETQEQKKFKLGVISSLRDEQKHFKLYVHELHKLGYEFGDFPLNNFFWNQMEKLKTPAQYLSLMSLTFEAANLDFAAYYAKLFEQMGEADLSKVFQIVLKDEISHVGLGVRFLNRWRGDKSLWTYYNENLPWPMTPARSKCKVFDKDLRFQSEMDIDFLKILRLPTEKNGSSNF
jgi:uncharacterized ferritin-like protein (DUF455 family)